MSCSNAVLSDQFKDYQELSKSVLGHEVTQFEEVKDQSTEDYFQGNQFSIDAFNKKYTIKPGETYVQALKRVCDYVASVEETPELREYWSKRWFSEIYNDWWHPAGSIMQGAGSGKKISLANCTTISLGLLHDEQEWDTLESIVKNTGYTVAKCAAYRQGLGVDFSRLRPRKMRVENSSNESQGAVHWMKWIDQIGYFVGQKGRIPAMLFSINCAHPDVVEFVKAKKDYTVIQNANISVQCTEAFYQAVEADEDWVMNFNIPSVKKGDKIYVDRYTATPDHFIDAYGYYYLATHDREGESITDTMKARDLLELIAQHMTKHAEPGIQNIDLARRLSNSDYVYDPTDEYDSRIISTNACSEQYLSPESLCVLASILVSRFSTKREDYNAELAIIGPSINRFLDDVNECELVYATYATPRQKLAIEKLRRTGAGYTDLVGWLIKQGEAYGQPSGNELVSEFTECYNYYLYKSSIELGKEKGSFGLFDRKKYEQSPFIQHMMELGLQFDTMRNVTVSSIAPVGTLSLMFRGMVASYGIEGAFGIYFWKRTRIAGKYEYYFCVPRVVRDKFAAAGLPLNLKADTVKDTWDGKIGREVAKFIDENLEKVGINFVPASKVNVMDKLDLMGKVMKNIDSSISTTYMLPKGADWKDTYEFILKAHKVGVKSVAAFPEVDMYGIVTPIPFKDLAFQLRDQGVGMHPQNFDEDELKELQLPAEEDQIVEKHAPKRPQELPVEIHQVSVQGQKWTFVVGLLNGKPYEVFGGKSEYIQIPKKITTGHVHKVKCTNNDGRKDSCYDLYAGDEDDPLVVKNLTVAFQNPDYAEATRLVSMSLRHGTPIKYVIEQISKNPNSGIVSFWKVLARILKRYLIDEETGQPMSEDTACRSGKCD